MGKATKIKAKKADSDASKSKGKGTNGDKSKADKLKATKSDKANERKSNTEPPEVEGAKPRRSKRNKSNRDDANDVIGGSDAQTRKRGVSLTAVNEQHQKKLKAGSSTDKMSTRRAPAQIKDSDTEMEPATPPIRFAKKAPAQEITNDDELSADEEDGGNDENMEELQEHDLHGMDSKKLKETIISESVQWSTSKSALLPKAAGSRSTMSSSKPAAQPETRQKQKKAMEVSEMQSESESSTDSSSSGSSSSSDESSTSESTSGSESESDKAQPEVKTKVSKRGLARRQEAPQWQEASSSVSRSRSTKASGGKHTANSLDVNRGWPIAAHYIPPGQRNLSLKIQPAGLQAVLQDAILEVVGDAIFEQAYPDVGGKNEYLKCLTRKCARDLDQTEISRRCKKDIEFMGHVARLLTARIGIVRTNVKKSIGAAAIRGFYDLPEGNAQACKDRVIALTSTLDYIYPVNQAGKVLNNQPFQHPAIIWILKDHFFRGARRSLANKYASRFTSSIENGPEKNVLEVPMAMLCMVATCIHASLDEWSSGTHNEADFNSDQYAGTYTSHEEFLGDILDEDPKKYHRMMSNLYNAAAYVNDFGFQSPS
ncbi:hypothetical protein BDZ97DRAFT_1710428 [Flammula alnicola]|nr:hypothetical protein BDZ97DRAFT_1710428 [Flammula alnicola]